MISYINMNYKGLSTTEAEKKIEEFGLNIIEEKRINIIEKILKRFISPISLMLLLAAFSSFYAGKLFDFYFILSLLFVNTFITFWHEKKSDDSIKHLMKHLSVEVNVLRNDNWQKINAIQIVPRDIIKISGGNIIPADLEILEASNLTINESSLTGESLPKDKNLNDVVYSGSFVVTGTAITRVRDTGKNTYFGKLFLSIDKSSKKSILEKDVLDITKYLSLLSVVTVFILTIYFFYIGFPISEIIAFNLSLIIAGIPISLPTVMTLIIGFGLVDLRKKNAVVRRLSSLEDLSNVNIFCTDKTGTLTKNKIIVNDIVKYGYSEKEIIFYAFLSSVKDSDSSINSAIIRKEGEINQVREEYEIINFLPADSIRKRSSTIVRIEKKYIMISVGAPQVIEKFVVLSDKEKNKFKEDVRNAADNGYRSLAVAVNFTQEKEEKMRLIGLLLLSDELREDSKDVISFLSQNGIEIKMLTGDHKEIAETIGKKIGLDIKQIYAEILPKDKYNIVKDLQKKGYIVAVTGDGVNDIPAVKLANVGIAVDSAVDALKSSADIVLLSSGISVIKDAIIDARKVFHRLYTYSVYRISESFRIIITIALIGLFYHNYPINPIQILILALLNDLPIISLAYNRVKISKLPSKINLKKRFNLSFIYGMIGVINSLLFFYLLNNIFHFDIEVLRSAFFLKLAISGHLLIYVVHTKERWYKFLPSKEVILATVGTQLIAIFLVTNGMLMSKVSGFWIIFVCIWAFVWMQICEIVKVLYKNLIEE